MLMAGNAQRQLEISVSEEIRDEERRASLLDGARHVAQRLSNIRPSVGGVEHQELADNVEHMLLTLFRGDELLHLVTEEDDANLIVVLYGREGQGGGHLSDEVLLKPHLGAELARARDIDKQHDSVLPLLLENLNVRLIHARGDIPVNIADIVAILILSDLAESHASTLEGRMVLASEDMVGEAAGLNLDLADALKQLRAVYFRIHPNGL